MSDEQAQPQTASHPASDASISRPTRSTPEMRLAAAREIASDIQRNCIGFDDLSLNDIAKQIAENAQDYDDGYQLAKRLDSRCYWDCDFGVAECLDNYSSLIRRQVEDAQKAWAAATNPQPPLPVGTRVRFRQWADRGVITEVYERGIAQYLVRIEGDRASASPSNSRRIVNYEDCIADEAHNGCERNREPQP